MKMQDKERENTGQEKKTPSNHPKPFIPWDSA